MSARNIGSAILILGNLYFGFHYGFNIWLYVLIIIGLLTMDYPTGSDEAKELMKAKAQYYYNKAAALEK